MSSPRTKVVNVGDLIINILDYVEVGDTLAMHVHGNEDEHIIIVGSGHVKLRVQEVDGSITESEHKAGAVIDTFAGYPHEVIGLSENARTIHVGKHFMKMVDK